MKTRPWKYIHTLDGNPAYYYPGEQIIFACPSRTIPLVDSLKQIKREQKASLAYRKKRGWNAGFDLGWAKIAMPDKQQGST